MNSNLTVRRAVMAILSAHAAASAQFAQAQDTGAGGIEEVIVTATRRAENLQNVPISIQALTGETLSELKVSTIEDFVKYLPSVSTATLGPGQGNIYMRGLSVGALGTQGSASVGAWPNVAVYLDDQSTQIPGRNLDVYAADLERIEVLEGPQGTLFGAGAQAGVLRYITNKPKQGKTEGSFSGGFFTTAHGAQSSKLEGVINLALTDKLAARLVVFNDSRGGYIDNVNSTFTRRSTDLGFARRTAGRVPTDSVVVNNDFIAGKDINPVTYKGARLGLDYQVNDDWSVLVTQTYQDMNTSGVFYELPFSSECPTPSNATTCSIGANGIVQGVPLKPLQVTIFNDGKTTDKFSNTALTVNGKVGSLDLVYTGAFLVRDSFQIQDYTNYARGVFGSYYQCTGFAGASVNKCYTPSSTWHDTTHNVNQSHEFRLSTPSDWKVSGIAGVFWEKRKLNDDTEWLYKSVPECSIGGPGSCFLWIDPSAAPKFNDASLNNPGRRVPSTGFFDDFKRTYTQKAAFVSADWHITDSLTLTAGTRYYDIKNEQLGANVGSFYCKVYGAGATKTGPCTGASSGNGDKLAPFGTNLNRQVPNNSKSNGFKSRANLSWKVTDTALVYATWSQGYRPGGFNRGRAGQLPAVVPPVIPGNPPTKGNSQWFSPEKYESDDLVNKEIGWKTTFLNNRLQINGAIYQEDWSNVQTGIFAPQLGFGNLTLTLNGPTNRVKGVELSVIARPTTGLTLQGSMSYNKGELVSSPQFLNNELLPDGKPGPNFGKVITQAYIGGANPIASIVNVFGQPGDSLANSPKLQANARARYEWSMTDRNYYVQVGVAHQGESFSSATVVNAFTMPSWTVIDASAGVSKDAWSAELVIQNLSDVNKSVFTSAAQFIRAQTPQRPRTIGLQIGYKFSDK